MNIRSEKIRRNRNRVVANEVFLKQSRDNSGFQFVDNRPLAVDQRRLQDIANNSSEVSQLRAFQKIASTDSSIHPDKRPIGLARDSDAGNQYAFGSKEGVVQGRFVGTLGRILSVLTPAALGATDTYYNNLWTALNDSGTDIAVENAGGVANFDPTTNTLNLKFQILKELLDHRKGTHVLANDVLADHVALISHELSHAHDSVVRGRELKGELGTDNALTRIGNVMMTEALAWEREARTRQRLMAVGDDRLWDGWFNLEPDMVADYDALKANKGTNEVVDRYYRYLRRELVAVDGDLGRINTWFAAQGAAVGAEMIRLSRALQRARNTI